jgi:hypothetical protein
MIFIYFYLLLIYKMAEVASNLLNYSPEGTRRRAVSSRGYRTLTPASNGSNFIAGNTINIDLPGNVQNTFFDFGSSYLKLRIQNDGTGAAMALEGGSGIYSMIKKIELVSGSSVLSTIDEYGALVNKFLTSDAAQQFKINTGAILAGTNSLPVSGTSIANNAFQTFCIPLVLTPLFNSAKYIPAFSRDQIRMRITLNSAAAGVISGAAPTNAQIKVDNVEFNCYMVELSNDAMRMVNDMTGGQYNIVVNDFRHAASTVAAAATTLNAVVGFSFSSLNRVIVLHRPQATINAEAAASIGNRATATLTQLSVLVNGEQYPQRPIKDIGVTAEGGAEPLAEALIADRSLGYFGHDSSTGTAVAFCIANPAGTANATVGNYFLSVDMESMRADDADKLYAGVDTLGAVVSVNALYTNVPAAMRVDCYAEYTMSLMLDMNGTGTFSVAL